MIKKIEAPQKFSKEVRETKYEKCVISDELVLQFQKSSPSIL